MNNPKSKLPPEYVNVMVVYQVDVLVGSYRTPTRRKITVKRKGFYSEMFNNFSVPAEWREFTFSDGTTISLPHGFAGDTLKVDDVIGWEPIGDGQSPNL